jgi:CRISPR system Cascade subunit CasB
MEIPQQNNKTTTANESLAKIIARIAGVIDSKHFLTGERAALKRLLPGKTPSLTFYRFAYRHLPKGWESRMPEWITIVSGIALMSPHSHRPQRPPGLALAAAGFSEARLERLLSAKDEVLYRLLLRAARLLAAKVESIDWTQFAQLILMTGDSEKREGIRLRIARDYFNYQKEKE